MNKSVLFATGLAAVLVSGCLEPTREPEPPFATFTARDYFDGAVEVFEPVLFRPFPGRDSTSVIPG